MNESIVDMQEEHYAIAEEWYLKKVGHKMQRDLFSNTAWMYYDGGKPIATVSAFICSPSVFINWLIANPEAAYIVKMRAFSELIAHAEKVSKAAGCMYSYCLATKPVIEKIFDRNNYSVAAVGCTEMFKVIGV